jgi:hypothetical protein
MAATRTEVAHFEAIGRAIAAEKRRDYAEAIRTSPAERIQVGFLLGDLPRSEAIEAMIEADAVGQIGFAIARRRLARQR